MPADAAIAVRPLPAGYALRDADPDSAPGGELRAVHQVIEDAFNEWPDRLPYPFEDWIVSFAERTADDAWQLRVVTDPSGAVVGVCSLVLSEDTAYVHQLAVCRAERGRGLAQALLADGFANGRAHGATVSELSTDSRTGALPLYERLGM